MALPLSLLCGALRHYPFRQAEPIDSIVCPWKILASLVELLNSLLNSLLNWNLFKCKIVRSEYVQPWHWLIGFLMSWLIVESKFGQSVFGELTICWKSTIVEVGFVLTDLSPSKRLKNLRLSMYSISHLTIGRVDYFWRYICIINEKMDEIKIPLLIKLSRSLTYFMISCVCSYKWNGKYYVPKSTVE